MKHWTKLVEEYEELEEKELSASFKKRKKPKLNHNEAKQIKEQKKNGVKYPKKRKR